MQVIARDKDDVDARYDRALLYAEVNEPKKAVIALDGILKGRPGEPEVRFPCNTLSSSEASQQSVLDRKCILPVHTRPLSTFSTGASPGADCIRTAEMALLRCWIGKCGIRSWHYMAYTHDCAGQTACDKARQAVCPQL